MTSTVKSVHSSSGSGMFRTLLRIAVGAMLGAFLATETADSAAEPEQARLAAQHAPITESEAADAAGVARLREQIHSQEHPGWNEPRPAELPAPTYSPAVVAFGIIFIAFGVVTTYWVAIVGVVLFIVGIGKWIGELRHEHSSRESDNARKS